MSKNDKPPFEVYHEWSEKYKEKFGKRFIIPSYAPMSRQKAVEVMRLCIEIGKPYKMPKIPEGSIA